ncbi:hypothetical protein ACS0TY_026638 [Phlomoides rotata]
MSFLFRNLPHPRYRWPLLLYAAAWTTILTVTVAVASFTPEIAFVSAIAPTNSACAKAGSVGLPLDTPSERLCFPARLIKRSGIDVVVPPVFAALVVVGSACLVKAVGLFEAEDEPL